MRIGISAGVGKNKTIRDALQEQGLSLDYVCGGIGRCGKCAVRVISGHVPVTGADRAFFSKEALEQGWRLACQMQVTDDIEIEVAEDLVCQKEAGIQVAGLYPLDEKTDQGLPAKSAYGVAIDLGTTTIGFALVDLATGQVERSLSRMNSQRIYGADVLSRIQCANEGQGNALRRCAELDLRQGIKDLCKDQIDVSGIRHIVIAGNTTMCHLLRGYSCQTLGMAPFRPVSTEQEDFVQKGIAVTILPGASAFVGGDIISGIYGIREHLDATDEPWMLLDLGTNGEMALWTGERFFATAAAAGPAFEGGNISCGCASIPGAISSVMIVGRNSHTKTIGGLPAIGICGSGLLEAISGMKKAGIVDENGTFASDIPEEGFVLNTPGSQGKVSLTQEDIRQFQMAKAAIAVGQKTLLKEAGMVASQVKKVYLAGGMGTFLNVRVAVETGLLVKDLLPVAKAGGNTSLGGAVSYLKNAGQKQKAEKDKLKAITENMQVLMLADMPGFADAYISHMALTEFGHEAQ